MSTTCHCGAEWTGLRVEHCAACHETFTGTSAGDKHRTGEHHLSVGPYRRRCLTPVEMAAKGMTRNSRGHWSTGGGFWGAGTTHDGSAGSSEGGCPETGVQALTEAHSDGGGNE